MDLTARDIMMPLSECVAQNDTLLEASRRLAESHFVPLPIVGDGQLLGLLKSAHLVAAVAEGRDFADTRIADISPIREGEFSANEASIPADATLDAVRHAMTEHQIGQVLVREGDEPTGVVTDAEMRSYTERAPDDLPIPPPELLRMVMGGGGNALWRRAVPRAFYESGARVAGRIETILRRRDLDLAEVDAVLDFGCGCGRITRHWKDLEIPRLVGADCNHRHIDWCRHSLSFAEFVANDSLPPLKFEDETFDFICAYSVFTHLRADLQVPWLIDLKRVMKPNGRLLLTVHGESHMDSLDVDRRRQFDSGELVVVDPEASGRNGCAVYHPRPYVYETFGEHLSIVDLILSDEAEVGQDMLLLEKTA